MAVRGRTWPHAGTHTDTHTETHTAVITNRRAAFLLIAQL